MIRLARRVLATLSLAGLAAALIRVRGKGGVPPQSGGWREIGPAELKQSAHINH